MKRNWIPLVKRAKLAVLSVLQTAQSSGVVSSRLTLQCPPWKQVQCFEHGNYRDYSFEKAGSESVNWFRQYEAQLV